MKLFWMCRKKSTGIFFGLIVGGTGKGWIDNVQLEIVGEDIPSTNSQAAPFSNEVPLRTELRPEGSARISTPLSSWFKAGTQPEAYETGVDTAVLQPNSDLPSVFIRGSNTGAAGSGDLVQTISARNYRGQRVSLMLHLRGDAITGQAAPWMRVDSLFTTLAKAEAGGLAMYGSQEWTPYELVLDVPEEASVISWDFKKGPYAAKDARIGELVPSHRMILTSKLWKRGSNRFDQTIPKFISGQSCKTEIWPQF